MINREKREIDFPLIKAYLKGDLKSFESLLKKYEGILYHYLYRYSKTQQEAQDLYQDVYIKVVKHLKNFKMESSYKTWLFTIARNTVIDKMRRKKLTVHSMDQTIGAGNTDFHERIGDIKNTPSTALTKGMGKQKIRLMLDDLEPRLKEICLLRFYSELKFREIASVLNMNENSVKTCFRRALEILREQFSHGM